MKVHAHRYRSLVLITTLRQIQNRVFRAIAKLRQFLKLLFLQTAV